MTHPNDEPEFLFADSYNMWVEETSPLGGTTQRLIYRPGYIYRNPRYVAPGSDNSTPIAPPPNTSESEQ